MAESIDVLRDTLADLEIADARVFDNLAVFPLFGRGVEEPGYLRLGEALSGGRLEITEVSEGGSVPELRVANRCEVPVLLLDGEELVGAKQNRILNLTVMVPAGSDVVIPVSCVEQGRWHQTHRHFEEADHVVYNEARAAKAAAVSGSLRDGGSRRSDQSELWSELSAKQSRMRAASPTGDVDAIYETHRSRLDDYVGAFSAVSGQTGALFAIDGQPAGLDMFDSDKTIAGLLPKLVRAYALDALDTRGPLWALPSRPAVERFLERLRAAHMDAYPAVGLGADVRLEARGLVGGALVHDERVVHACAFRPDPARPRPNRPNGRRGRERGHRWRCDGEG